MNKKILLLEAGLHFLIYALFLVGFGITVIQELDWSIVALYVLFGILLSCVSVTACKDLFVQYNVHAAFLSRPRQVIAVILLGIASLFSCIQVSILSMSDHTSFTMIALIAILCQAAVLQRGYALILIKEDTLYFHHRWIKKSKITEMWSDHFNKRIKVILYTGKKRFVEEVNEETFQKLYSLFPDMKEA